MIPLSVKAQKLIHICDDDLKTCEELSTLFRLEGYETTFSVSEDQFIAAIDKRAPDVAVLSLDMEEASGLKMLAHVRSVNVSVILVMLSSGNLERAIEAMRRGAIDVLSKPTDHERLLHSIANGLARDVEIGAPVNGVRQVSLLGFKQLTSRERDVLQLIVDGNTSKEAARALGISSKTVEVHRARVIEKFNARNTAHLMRLVLAG
jgi:two-component system response regulator FixJ